MQTKVGSYEVGAILTYDDTPAIHVCEITIGKNTIKFNSEKEADLYLQKHGFKKKKQSLSFFSRWSQPCFAVYDLYQSPTITEIEQQSEKQKQKKTKVSSHYSEDFDSDERSDMHYRKGQRAQRKKHYVEAIQQFTKAEECSNNSKDMKKYSKAAQKSEKCLDIREDKAKDQFKKGKRAEKEGDFTVAEKFYTNAAKISQLPKNQKMYKNARNKAIDVLTEIKAQELYNLGLTAENEDDLIKAGDLFHKAYLMSQDTDNYRFYRELRNNVDKRADAKAADIYQQGLQAERVNDLEKASDLCHQAYLLSHDRNMYTIYKNATNNIDLKIELLTENKAKDSYNEGVVAEQRGDFKKAYERYDNAYNLSQVTRNYRKYERAKNNLKPRLIEIEALEMYSLGQAAQSEREFIKAGDLYYDAYCLTQNKDNKILFKKSEITADDWAAHTYYLQGKEAEKENDFKKAGDCYHEAYHFCHNVIHRPMYRQLRNDADKLYASHKKNKTLGVIKKDTLPSTNIAPAIVASTPIVPMRTIAVAAIIPSVPALVPTIIPTATAPIIVRNTNATPTFFSAVAAVPAIVPILIPEPVITNSSTPTLANTYSFSADDLDLTGIDCREDEDISYIKASEVSAHAFQMTRGNW